MGHTKKLIIHRNLLKTLSYANHSPTPPKSSFVNTLAIKIIHLFFLVTLITLHTKVPSQVLQENLNTKIYEQTYNPVEYFKRKWMNIIIHWFLFNKIVSLIRFLKTFILLMDEFLYYLASPTLKFNVLVTYEVELIDFGLCLLHKS